VPETLLRLILLIFLPYFKDNESDLRNHIQDHLPSATRKDRDRWFGTQKERYSLRRVKAGIAESQEVQAAQREKRPLESFLLK
jgi:hypothetical protein